MSISKYDGYSSNTTYIKFPDPNHKIVLSLGEKHVEFKAKDMFDVLVRLIETKGCGDEKH